MVAYGLLGLALVDPAPAVLYEVGRSICMGVLCLYKYLRCIYEYCETLS